MVGNVGERKARIFDRRFTQPLCDVRGDALTLCTEYAARCGENQLKLSFCVVLDESGCCAEQCGCFMLVSMVNVPESLLLD